ncbi:hypothetical protein PPTG_05628 [Phytophthora nicotianae INRA-310]|uniref:Uncharacterized protein n=1 Tax=Phytophthora nicotianae (strain INRA-310) TaxID=761204 RepID=W2R0E6_PHYN3|nr:hypothetical protein PPTG_05628 [Phytophthora nicotianae INRA-310]ETN17985.1 hypothetical protein PPTG_05628 [Phytophthora nicotianae INRA-310]
MTSECGRRVQIQAEDYSGSISPHYGNTRPSVGYFNSNLMIQNFVVADITNGRNNVYFNDKRAQGKDANALFSLRLLNHLSTLKNNIHDGIPPPDISFSILDSCVGQNKPKACSAFYFLDIRTTLPIELLHGAEQQPKDGIFTPQWIMWIKK